MVNKKLINKLKNAQRYVNALPAEDSIINDILQYRKTYKKGGGGYITHINGIEVSIEKQYSKGGWVAQSAMGEIDESAETLEVLKNRLERMNKTNDSITYDERLRSPEGGVTIKGKFYQGGQFIPSSVDQEEAKKAIAKKQAENAKGNIVKKNNNPIKKTDFDSKDLHRNANFKGHVFKKGFFDKDIIKSDFTNSKFVFQKKVKIEGSKLVNSDFTNTNFKNVILDNVDFHNIKLTNAKFENVKFNDVGFNQKDMSGITFKDCNIDGIDFYRSMNQINWKDTKFIGIDFSDSNFDLEDIVTLATKHGVQFKGCEYYHVDLDKLLTSKKEMDKVKLEVSKIIDAKINIDDDTDYDNWSGEPEYGKRFFDAKIIKTLCLPLKGAKRIDVGFRNTRKGGEVDIQWTDKKNNTGNISFEVKGDVLDAGYMEMDRGMQKSGVAFNLIRSMEQEAKKKKIKKVKLQANITIGPYAWPRLGFDFSDKRSLGVSKKCIIKFLEDNNIPITNQLKGKIDKLKTANDVASFDIGKKFTQENVNELDSTRETEFERNPDVPKGLKMHVGKIVLLNSSYLNSFNAHKIL